MASAAWPGGIASLENKALIRPSGTFSQWEREETQTYFSAHITCTWTSSFCDPGSTGTASACIMRAPT